MSLTVTALWTGVSTQLSRDSVKTYDWIALFVFIAVFVVIHLVFCLITRQVITDETRCVCVCVCV